MLQCLLYANIDCCIVHQQSSRFLMAATVPLMFLASCASKTSLLACACMRGRIRDHSLAILSCHRALCLVFLVPVFFCAGRITLTNLNRAIFSVHISYTYICTSSVFTYCMSKPTYVHIYVSKKRKLRTHYIHILAYMSKTISLVNTHAYI